MKAVRILLLLAAVAVTGCAPSTLIDFNSLGSICAMPGCVPVAVGDQFGVGDVIRHNPSGTEIEVLPYQWPGGVWTNGGMVEIVAGTRAGGSGNEVHFNNASLGIRAPASTPIIRRMKVKFGDYGGNVNLISNGVLQNVGDYFALPAVLPPPPGVAVTVTGALPLGQLALQGPMDRFSHTFGGTLPMGPYAAVVGGGQELWIDDLWFRH